MQGMNCVGTFFDSEGIIAAAYAGSPDYIKSVFASSLDPSYVVKSVYDKLIDGTVRFSDFVCYDEKGTLVMSFNHVVIIPWKELSLMDNKSVLHALYTEYADSRSPQFSDILEYPVYAYLKESSDENK